GQVVARSSYANHLLSLFVELRNKLQDQQMKPDLLVSGTVPYEISLAGTSTHKPQGEINLTMYSKGLNLELLDPFLPAVSNLTGTVVCDMKIHGTVDAPTYEGSVALQDAKFMFDPLGISYTVHGKLIPNGSRVGLENFVIRNVPQDRTDGLMNLSGTFSLANLRFGDFDLRANGQLMVMKESSRLAGQPFYGDLFLATGPGGVRWDGQLSASRVAGDVLIKYGKFTFPPEREAGSVTEKAVNVIFRDDTSKPAQKPVEFREASLDRTDTYASLGPVPGPEVPERRTDVQESAAVPDAAAKSFLDNIAYDLGIDVQGPTSLRFIFNTQPSEELFADLRGKLAFSKNAAQTRLTGEVNLESRSYYYFFKRFDASGKINFTGDPVNPQLDVTAKYEGTHAIDTLSIAQGVQRPRTVSGEPLTSERVDVLLQISGTKTKPKTKFALEFPDRDKNTQFVSKDPDGDAMSFLVTGYLKDELTSPQPGTYLGFNMLSNLGTALITGPMTSELKKWVGALQSLDLQTYGGDLNKTDVRVTAEISSAVIRVGGRVIEGINNTNVSVEVPVGNVFGLDRWRNLLLKYERKVDAVENIDQRTQSNSLSIFYRFVF
ncbi:MAG TPA: translocation/assembly module TamB domain-containing protein, partial [Bacteroidota bacterium]|nr:translocation/assembly module TamB domain-containing protein [Bacteroidota bacterium]